MDQASRNALRRMVTQCRKVVEKATSEVLEGQFGVHDDGTIEDAARMTHLSAEDVKYREQILTHYAHIQAQGFGKEAGMEHLVREVAFTHLNRLVAYKMAEQRKLIKEAVSRGTQSNGFKFFLADHASDRELWTSGKEDVAYRHYLEWLGSTLSEEIFILFSENDPANRLFPKHAVLKEVLDLINDPELKDVWSEDETIGWVYQYFTPKELRDEARKKSPAPRNSYELAFRNQFYTPRYVVQFLVENTLGRIWYEMRKGSTSLKDMCHYLVRQPNEVFLGPHDPVPPEKSLEGLSQEEILREPNYIPHRPKKDPRELRIIDPAMGSGHFLLYSFELLERIYQEAYEDPELGGSLKKDFQTIEEFQRAIPELILKHNLHGIDIDLRATQIAAMALWLRAQRYYQSRNIPRADRRKITRSNIVCAEPMPGEANLLNEFVAGLEPKLLGQLVQTVFDKMRLASEAGSLLKIETEIRDTVSKAKAQWLSKPAHEQLALFAGAKLKPAQQTNLFDVASVTDVEFWEKAEARVFEALEQFAKLAANGTGFLKRLFADDAERGFAFVDVSGKTFDVVLMNPPFGEASKPSRAYIDRAYPRTKNDVYAAFVERWLGKLQKRGMLGAITSRTGFFLSSFQKWREEILLKEARPTVFADLGYGVLDTAMVETAAYCLESVDA